MPHVVASLHSDERGFALQTVIVMTAMIAIAMAVAAVIYTRGGEVADDLERQNITFDPSVIVDPTTCDATVGLAWNTLTTQCEYE